jgi:hypothetical protein
MSRYAITWAGVVNRTVPVETTADALYWCWSRFRDEFVGGLVVEVEAGRGIRLAQVSFQARMTREIEAEDANEAVRSFLYDDRIGSTVALSDLHVEELDRQPRLALVEAAA